MPMKCTGTEAVTYEEEKQRSTQLSQMPTAGRQGGRNKGFAVFQLTTCQCVKSDAETLNDSNSFHLTHCGALSLSLSFYTG